MMESQVKAKENYDRTAQKLTPLNIGDSVHVQRDKLWEPAKVISQLTSIRTTCRHLKVEFTAVTASS